MATKNGNTVFLQAVIMIDLATGWIALSMIPSAWADLVSIQVELAWLTRYPLHSKIIVDGGYEFLVEFKTMI